MTFTLKLQDFHVIYEWDFQSYSWFLEITRDNLTSTSVKVVPITVLSNENFCASKNIAVSMRYMPKSGARAICAHAHIYVFTGFCWPFSEILSYINESGRKLKPVISSIALHYKIS